MDANPYYDDRKLIELLEKWQSGNFTRADERALRELAGKDAFAGEATEGFTLLPDTDHQAHIAALRRKIRQKSGVGQVAYLRPLMAAAALILLIVAVVWLIPTQKEQSIAQAPPPPTAGEQRADPALPPDTGATLSTTSSETKTIAHSAPQPSATGGAVAPTMERALSKPAPSANNTLATRSSTDDEMQPPAGEKADVIALEAEEAPAAPIKDAAPGVSYGKASESLKKKTKTVENVSMPVGGWDAFRLYLARNARLPEAARQHNVSGYVALSFDLDAANQPVNFDFSNRLGYGCEEEAVRLIKAYNWQAGTPGRVSVQVPFVR